MENRRTGIAVTVACALSCAACGSSPARPTVSIGIQPDAITLGGSASLTWSTRNASSCSASGAWSGTQAASGTATESPTATGTYTYTLTCQNSAGAKISGSATLTVNPPPAPTVTMSFSPALVPPGSTSTLSWSTSNASACTASGAWSGSEPTSGSMVVSQSSIGDHTYALACTGDGGATSGSASLLVTHMRASSYKNKNDLGSAPTTLPGAGGNAFALADFFQDGTESLVLHTLEYNVADPSTYGNHGHIHFYKRDALNAWVDQTSVLLANNVGCLHPRKAVVADFNRDGKPDVYFACHGIDAPPFSGEHPHVLMSQPDGTYANVTLPVTCYCHSASAADIDGDGFADVLVTDTSVANTPFFLINDGHGGFAADYNRLPKALLSKGIYTAELIDFAGSGHYDVFLGGSEPGTTPYPASEFAPQILPNDGSGNFTSTTPVNLLVGPSYGLALDIVFANASIYLLKVNSGAQPPYTSNVIQKIAYPALTASIIYSHAGAYSNGNTWLDWILQYNGTIAGWNASYGVSVPQ